MTSHTTTIRWARRIPPVLIVRRHKTDALGLRYMDLVDEVGYVMLARCDAIRKVTERRCRHCEGHMQGSTRRGAVVTCDACGWTVTWKQYHMSHKRDHVH